MKPLALALLVVIAVLLYNIERNTAATATDMHAAAVELQRERAEKDSVRALYLGMLVEWESMRDSVGYVEYKEPVKRKHRGKRGTH